MGVRVAGDVTRCSFVDLAGRGGDAAAALAGDSCLSAFVSQSNANRRAV